MVGDAEAVEAALAVEVDELGHGELAVGPGGVGVEIAEEEFLFARRGAFSARIRDGLSGARGYWLYLFEGDDWRGRCLFEQETRDRLGSAGLAERAAVAAPKLEHSAAIAIGAADPFRNFAGLLRASAGIRGMQELDVGQLGRGRAAKSNERAMGHDGLVPERGVGPADEKMMAGKQVGNAREIGHEFEAVGCGERAGDGADFRVVADEGERPVGLFQKPAEQLGGFAFCAVENPEHVQQSAVGRRACAWAQRGVTKNLDAFRNDRREREGYALIRYDEEIAGGARPAFGDGGDKADHNEVARAVAVVELGQHAGVGRVENDDDVRTRGAQLLQEGGAKRGGAEGTTEAFAPSGAVLPRVNHVNMRGAFA